ncbi:MAG TPA: TIGR03749 family integrating conjugative element protein, partial [Noviherbaspirillum sp.]
GESGIKRWIGAALLAVLPFSSHAQVEIASTKNAASPSALTGSTQVDNGKGLIEDAAPAQQPAAQASGKPKNEVSNATASADADTATARQHARVFKMPPTAKPAEAYRAPASMTDEEVVADTGIERVLFKRSPVRVLLRPEKERILHFPNPVTIHMPEDQIDLFRPVDVMDRSIYITALSAFPRMRAIVEDLTTGKMIPLDLQSSKDAIVSSEMEIHLAAGSADREHQDAAAGDEEGNQKVDMVALARYASRMLYAPRRLMPQVAGIRQVKVAVRPVRGLYPPADVETTPIGAWRSQDLFVTAMKFVNRSKTPVELDLEELRGNWVAAAAQHGRLGPAGSDEDTTAVYLISERTFEESR